MKKRFTRGGGAPLVLTVIALIISLTAAFEEYIARFIYNLAFKDNKADKVFVSSIIGFFTMERNSVSVIRVYTEKAFIIALVAFAAFLVLAASARKKKIVSGEAWMMIISAAACAIEPVIYMIHFFSNSLYKNFSDSNDGVRFRSFYGFLIYALPLIAAFLLVLAGFILLIRLAREKAVEISSEEPAAAGDDNNDTAADDTYAAAFMPQTEPVMPEAAIPPQSDEPAFAAADEPKAEPEIPQAAPAAEEAAAEEPAEEETQPEPLITHEPEKVFCASCGNQLDPAAKFCNNCGAKRS